MSAVAVRAETALETCGPCVTCGIQYAVPAAWLAQKRLDHSTLYCPNGHAAAYNSETEAQRLAKALAAANAQIANEKKRVEWAQQEAANHKHVSAGLRGELTKIKERIGNGVCPCCNRTFQQLARHMNTKHPGYKFPDAATSEPQS